MQHRAPHAQGISFRKRRREGNVAIHKAYAAKGLRFAGVQHYPQIAQCGQAIGHQPFAASFIDGRTRTIRECDTQSFAARGDRRGQTCGTAPDDK